MENFTPLNFEQVSSLIALRNEALVDIDCDDFGYRAFLLDYHEIVKPNLFTALIKNRFTRDIVLDEYKLISKNTILSKIRPEGNYLPCSSYVVEIFDGLTLDDPPSNTDIEFNVIKHEDALDDQLYFPIALFRAIFEKYPTATNFYFTIGKRGDAFSIWREVILFKFDLPGGGTALYDYSQDPPIKSLYYKYQQLMQPIS